jgi:hypothetical protein
MRDRVSASCFFNEPFSFRSASTSALFAEDSPESEDWPQPMVKITTTARAPLAALVRNNIVFIIFFGSKTGQFNIITTAWHLAKLHKTGRSVTLYQGKST